MSFTEAVIKDAQAIIANGQTSSLDPIVTTIRVLAWLFFLKYYEPHKSSNFSLAEIQEMIEYNDSLDATLAQINLSGNEYQRLSDLVDTTLVSQEQPTDDKDDEISHFYSSLLALLTPQHKATGAYPTPQPIARFMAKITDPKSTDMKIYDPACGTCSLLVAAHTNMASQSEKEPIKSLFFGCDNDPNILPLGKMNMTLHTIDSTKVQLQDALTQPLNANGSNPQQLSFLNEFDTSTIALRPVQEADVILNHPPHGRYKNLHSQTKLAWYDSQFLQHCMNTLKENGRCAIVVSDRTLSDPQKKHTELRRELFTKFSIQLIVALPPETFGPLSSQKTYLLFFIASQPTQKALHYELPRKKGPIEYEDFQPILDIWKDWNRHLKNEVQLLVLPKGMRIEPYEDLHYAELLRAQGEITKNPYKLYRPPPPQKYSPPADPRTLVGQILKHNQEIHDIALEIQALLNKKEFLS